MAPYIGLRLRAIVFSAVMLVSLSALAQDYSGPWWQPSTSGQGLTLLHEGSTLSGAWYLYDERGEGMWLTFVGELAGDTMTTDLLSFTGPPLGTQWQPSLVSSKPAGTVTLSFDSSTSASFDYAIGTISGQLQLVPFDVTGGGQPEGQYGGTWYDPERSGQGITLTQRGSTIGGAWYLYDLNGRGIWVTFIGELAGSAVDIDLKGFTGPALGSTWNPLLVKEFSAGTAKLTFDSSRSARLEYTVDGVPGSLPLQPFSLGGGDANCANIAGVWTGTETVNVACNAGGEQINQQVGETGAIEISQNGCDVSYTVPGFNFPRKGRVSGDQLSLSGDLMKSIIENMQFSENTVAITGSVTGDTLEMSGEGRASGTVDGANFSCNGSSTANFTRGSVADLGPCLDVAGLYRGSYSGSYCDGGNYSGSFFATVKSTDCTISMVSDEGLGATGKVDGTRFDARGNDIDCGPIDLAGTVDGTRLTAEYRLAEGGSGSLSGTKDQE